MKTGCLIVALFLATGGGIAVAQTNYNDTVNCRWKDGREMNERDCAFFRKLKADDEAEEAAHRVRSQVLLDKQRQQREAQEKAGADFRAARQKELDELNERDRQKKQALAQQRDQEARQRLAQEEAETAQLKKKCGADFRRPTIGQSVERFQQCVAPVDLIGQINRKDGIVTTYEGSGYTVHSMNGKVVAWIAN